jgi:hypothetical protein
MTAFRFDDERNLHVLEKALPGYPGWKVVVGVDVDDDQPAIVEVTVTKGHPIADFIRDLGGEVIYEGPPVEHARRVTTRMLRSISLMDVTDAANAWLVRSQLDRLPDPLKEHGGRSDRYYAVWAAHYAKLLQKGSRSPIKELAEKHGLDRDKVRDTIHQARVRGMLPKSVGGVADGQLTPKAVQLLQRKAR